MLTSVISTRGKGHRSEEQKLGPIHANRSNSPTVNCIAGLDDEGGERNLPVVRGLTNCEMAR